ncbi:hypothetical protein Tco_0530052 [Tanacetum coccineum]
MINAGKAHELRLTDPEPCKNEQTGSDSGKEHGVLLLDQTLEHMEKNPPKTSYSYSLPRDQEKTKVANETKTVSQLPSDSSNRKSISETSSQSALFKHMNKNKTANRNPANYHLYHALLEALIADEDAMDKEGKSAKRRRHDSGASGLAQPPIKDDEQSSKKPRKSDASASKQHPALTSLMHITDTRDVFVTLPKNRSDPQIRTVTKSENCLSISKLKAARYLDFGHDRIYSLLWVESERDITTVRPMASLTGGLEKEIILRRADYKEYKISEKDFKNLHPNDFEDLFLLNIQEKLNHLPKTDKTSLHTAVNMWIKGKYLLEIESYQTKINLERLNWDAADYYFKEDYTIVPKPRVVVYRDRNDQRKLMRLNELHKFSDGTLTRVMEKLDHMVKDFHLFEYNKGMETRKWSEDDKRRSKDFITAIEKRLQIRRIFQSLETFVGGRIRDIDYRLINRTT